MNFYCSKMFNNQDTTTHFYLEPPHGCANPHSYANADLDVSITVYTEYCTTAGVLGCIGQAAPSMWAQQSCKVQVQKAACNLNDPTLTKLVTASFLSSTWYFSRDLCLKLPGLSNECTRATGRSCHRARFWEGRHQSSQFICLAAG